MTMEQVISNGKGNAMAQHSKLLTEYTHTHSDTMLAERNQDKNCVSLNPYSSDTTLYYTQNGAVKREPASLSWPQRNPNNAEPNPRRRMKK